MVLQLAQAGDPTNNATVAWPDDRKKVVAGRLKVTAVTDTASCDGINFNPLILPTGIEGSDDPLLAARAGSYAVSQARRLSK
jgi:catalase